MTRFACFTSARITSICGLAAGLLPLATIVACEAPLDVPPPGSQPPAEVPVAAIEIQGLTGELGLGQVVALTARVRGQDGALLDRPVAWASSDPGIATISADGVLTARGPGQVRITASVDGREAVAVISVRAGALAMVSGLVPASVQAGSSGFELSIRGTGFQQGATVRLAGTQRPARVISATEIRIDVSAEDVRLAGGLEVRVWNPGQALGSNTTFFIVLNIPSTQTYDLIGSAWQEAGLPVRTGFFFYDGDLNRQVEQFVTAGVLRIHQPPTGAVTWDLALTMVTKTLQGEVLEQDSLVFFGTVEWPAPGGQMALRSGMFPNLVLHTVAYSSGDLVVYQTLHPTGDSIHEQAWRYRPRP
jgi:hypothetical protein